MTFSVSPTSVQSAPPWPGSEVSAAVESGTKIGFGDLLDVVNPLQHIPVVSHVYRHLTGDAIRAPFRLAGGALFGGPLGAAFAAGGILIDAVRGAGEAPAPSSAPAGPVFEARGGWMVAATRGHAPATTNAVPAPVLAGTAVRRGGWLAAASYAHTDHVTATRAGALRERA